MSRKMLRPFIVKVSVLGKIRLLSPIGDYNGIL